MKLKGYLKKRRKEYIKRGFGNCKDVEELADSGFGDKEIRRCNFLLNTLKQIEDMK